MKLFMILGGLVGFVIGLLSGVWQGNAWPGVLWRASVAALVAGWLFRWWGRVWIRSLVAAHRERLNAPARPDAPPATGPAKV
jgi:hypothetical protein